jgi:DNA polymerase III epsilon subunit-like protein
MPPELGTLASVVKYFGIPTGHLHNAKVDTLATVEVYKKMIELMHSKKESGGQSVDLISMLESE